METQDLIDYNKRFDNFELVTQEFLIVITQPKDLPTLCDIVIYKKKEDGKYENTPVFQESNINLSQLLKRLIDYA
jgi:hypothetical protein